MLGQEELRLRIMRSVRTKHARFEVQASGTSMVPLIPDGSKLDVECCQVGELRQGDVVVFRDGDNLSAHRCILRFRNRFYERGDNCGLWTRCLSRAGESVVGRVVAVYHSNGVIHDLQLQPYQQYGRLLAWIGLLSAFVGWSQCCLRTQVRYRHIVGQHEPLRGLFRRIIDSAYGKLIAPGSKKRASKNPP